MKYIIETGCDGATLCFFDPVALPDDFDAQIETNPVGLMENLQQQQRLWFGGTGGDGGYIFHVYVDENLPASLHTKANHIDSFDAFVLPSGQLCICGAEYAANDPMKGSSFTPAGGLGNYSHMGDIIELDAGVYSIEVFAIDCEWSEQQREAVESSVVPKKLLRRHRCLEFLMALCLSLGAIVLAISAIMTIALFLITGYNYFFQPHLLSRLTTVLQIWLPMTLGSGFLFALGVLLSRCYNRSNITQALQFVAKEIPDYVLLVAKQDRKSKELAMKDKELALQQREIAYLKELNELLKKQSTQTE